MQLGDWIPGVRKNQPFKEIPPVNIPGLDATLQTHVDTYNQTVAQLAAKRLPWFGHERYVDETGAKVFESIALEDLSAMHPGPMGVGLGLALANSEGTRGRAVLHPNGDLELSCGRYRGTTTTYHRLPGGGLSRDYNDVDGDGSVAFHKASHLEIATDGSCKVSSEDSTSSRSSHWGNSHQGEFVMQNGKLVDKQTVDFPITPWPVAGGPSAQALARRYNEQLAAALARPLNASADHSSWNSDSHKSFIDASGNKIMRASGDHTYQSGSSEVTLTRGGNITIHSSEENGDGPEVSNIQYIRTADTLTEIWNGRQSSVKSDDTYTGQ